MKIPRNHRLGICAVIAPQPETPEHIAKKQQRYSNGWRAELKIFGHAKEFVFMKKMLGRIICHKCHRENKRQQNTHCKWIDGDGKSCGLFARAGEDIGQLA